MGPSKEAPQQHKQSSRKGKKAWRKNIDVTDVQAGLEEAREEVIKGFVLLFANILDLEQDLIESQWYHCRKAF